MTYQGHKDWGHWSVALWVGNEKGLYDWAVELVEHHGQAEAARVMYEELAGRQTPDGADYTVERLYAAMDELVEDQKP